MKEMMKKSACHGHRSLCPISVSLEVFGDRWTLLIVRDLMFFGRKSFLEFMTSDEKIASNILTDRLKTLEAHGVVERRRDRRDGRRLNYILTEKGIDLAPVMIDIVQWAAKYERTAAPPDVVRDMRVNRSRFLADVRRRWEQDRHL